MSVWSASNMKVNDKVTHLLNELDETILEVSIVGKRIKIFKKQ